MTKFQFENTPILCMYSSTGASRVVQGPGSPCPGLLVRNADSWAHLGFIKIRASTSVMGKASPHVVLTGEAAELRNRW